MTDVREKVLQKQLLKIAEEHGYGNPEFKIKAVPVTGSNFTSELFHATISSPAKQQDLNLFAKVAVIGEEVRKAMPSKMFDIERFVYTKLLTAFKEIEDKHKVPEEYRLVQPKFYGYSETFLEEVIVLEDLSVDDFTIHDRFKSIDWEYAAASIEQLAKFHGLSIAFQMEYPDDYEEAKNVLKSERVEVTEQISKQMEAMIAQSVQMVREENRAQVQSFFNNKFDPTEFMNETIGKRLVITHGDLKQANLMHKTDENGQLQVIIIDYQTLRPNCAASDLLYFMFNCADGAFRKQYFHKVLDHYYQHIAAVLRRLHLDPEEVYPRADFDDELTEMLPITFLNSLVILPILYVNQTDVRQFEPEEGIEAFTSMMMKPTALCADRINDLVEDCLRWGVLQ